MESFSIINFFKERIDIALKSGVNQNNIILDPGIGFGKTILDNYMILNNIDIFTTPIEIYYSRRIGENGWSSVIVDTIQYSEKI